MGKNRKLTSVITASAVALALVSCSGEKPSPEDAAASLAQGLANLDVSASAFTSGTASEANAELERLLEGMGELRPAVTVAGIETDEGDDAAATARLAYAWDLNGDAEADWTYETRAPLQRAEDDAWLVEFSPTLVLDTLAPGERLTHNTVAPPRAAILDRDGQPLVQPRPVLRVGIDKANLPQGQAAASAAAMAEMVGLDPAAYTAQVEASGPEAFVEAIVQRAEADGPATDEGIAAIPGAAALADTRDLAPTRTFARALLGTVGEATAELIESSEGRLSPGDQTGLSGLQQQYEDQLSGEASVTVNAATEDGQSRHLFTSAPVEGTPLQTTLDPRLQALAETVLEEEPSASAIVAIQPSTGEILTVANGPGSEGQQTALLGQYPPGSTFKIATSLALLRQGNTPDAVVQCPAETTVDGRKFSNVPGYPAAATGSVPLRTAFANSCNTAFINARNTVSQQDLATAAADLGIGVAAPMGVPGYFGSVPESADGTAHAASMIGQGEVLVSPLALAVAAASVGKGERVSPFLVPGTAAAGEAPASGTASASPSPTAGGSATSAPAAGGSITAAEAASLRDMMRAVVAEGGAAMLLDVPGEPVLAKTGTAEFGSETPPRTHAWVVALQGDLAVAVFVSEGELGSTSGGPLMKAFLAGAAG